MFLKIAEIKILKKHSITSRSYALTYIRTLEEVMWLLRLEKPKKNKIFKKLEKKLQVAYKTVKICDKS